MSENQEKDSEDSKGNAFLARVGLGISISGGALIGGAVGKSLSSALLGGIGGWLIHAGCGLSSLAAYSEGSSKLAELINKAISEKSS